MKLLVLFGLQRLCPKCKAPMAKFDLCYQCRRCGHTIPRSRR